MNHIDGKKIYSSLFLEVQQKESMDKIKAGIDRVEDILNICLESLEKQVTKHASNPDYNMVVLTTRVAEITSQLLKLQEVRYMIISHQEHRSL